VTHLRKIMLEEPQRRNYSDSTIRHYLHWVEEFARHSARHRTSLTWIICALIRLICSGSGSWPSEAWLTMLLRCASCTCAR
jgi:hypothetical protein